MQTAALVERVARLEAVQREQQAKALALAEAAHLGAQDGTRALRLSHHRLLRSRRGLRGKTTTRTAATTPRLTLDKLRVLIDTGLIFVGNEAEEDEEDGEQDGAGADSGQLGALAELLKREATTRRRVERLEQENQRLVAQQQQLARLLARTVAALEAVSIEVDRDAVHAGVGAGVGWARRGSRCREEGNTRRGRPHRNKTETDPCPSLCLLLFEQW